MKQNLTVLAMFLGLSSGKFQEEQNATIAMMQQDAVQHLAELES